MKSTHESEIVLARFEDVCPPMDIKDKDIKNLVHEVMIGFRIIGYLPKDVEKATKLAVEKMSHKGELYRLCYNAWRLDE